MIYTLCLHILQIVQFKKKIIYFQVISISNYCPVERISAFLTICIVATIMLIKHEFIVYSQLSIFYQQIHSKKYLYNILN